MLRKTIAITVALLMVLPLLTACSTGTPAPTTAAATSAAATTAAEATTAAATEAATATPSAPVANANRCPYQGTPVTFNIFTLDCGVKEDVNSPVYQIYKKAVGNIDIKWETAPASGDYDTKVKIYLNSGTMPDLMWVRAGSIMRDYSNSGLFLDFNKYKDAMPNWVAISTKNPGLLTYQTTDGAQYTIHELDNDYPDESFIYNKTELDKVGITTVPKTLDEFTADLQTIKEKDPTVTPFHTFWGINYYEEAFGYALNAQTDNNSGVYFDNADKKWKFVLTSPESNYKQLIALLADYYKKGYINPEFSTMSDDQTTTLMSSSKWAFTFTYGGQINTWYKVDNNGTLPIDAEPMLPVAATGVKANIGCAYVSDAPYWGYVASAKISNPELACSWLDTELSEPVSTAFQWGIEGTSYTKDASTGKKSWIQSFLDQGSQAALNLGIWNTMGPRYECMRDDTSLMAKDSPLEKNVITTLVNAIKSGTIDSYYHRNQPKFTSDETDALSVIMTPVNTKLTEDEALFILGKRPMSDWDSFVKEVQAAGDIDKAMGIYNNAAQCPDRAQGIDRSYIAP